MKRWLILSAVVVALSATATVALQYLPELSANVDARSNPAGSPAYPVGSSSRPSSKSDREMWREKPRAVLVGEPIFEFGTLAQNVTGKHSWVVKNEGKGILELTMISSTCSCTVAKFKDGTKAYVKPGESTEITLEFETRTNVGPYEKGAEIGTSDPDLPRFPLHVKGMVYPAVMLYPPLEGNVLNLMDVRNDDEHILSRIGVYSRDRPGTKIVKVTTSDPKHIKATWEPVKADELKSMKLEGCQRLTIDMDTDLPLGPFRHEVVVETDHPKQPELRIYLSGTLLGPISIASPGRLIMNSPPADGKNGDRGEIILTAAEGRETKFEVVKVPKGLKAEVVSAGDPSNKGLYKLVVIIPPGTPAQTILSYVDLKTDHPRAATLQVPVSIWIRD